MTVGDWLFIIIFKFMRPVLIDATIPNAYIMKCIHSTRWWMCVKEKQKQWPRYLDHILANKNEDLSRLRPRICIRILRTVESAIRQMNILFVSSCYFGYGFWLRFHFPGVRFFSHTHTHSMHTHHRILIDCLPSHMRVFGLASMVADV